MFCAHGLLLGCPYRQPLLGRSKALAAQMYRPSVMLGCAGLVLHLGCIGDLPLQRQAGLLLLLPCSSQLVGHPAICWGVQAMMDIT